MRLTGIATLALLLAALLPAGGALGQGPSNSLGMAFALIPPGSFVMGSDLGADSDEGPPHGVAITKAFRLGAFEVTQAQWLALMEDNPSQFPGPDSPVDSVTWEQAQEFIRRLNAKEGTDRYRLPTEAEWEYAARAGTQGPYYFGDPAALGDHAWFAGNSGGTTHVVGLKAANPFGLHDVYGNVYEWVGDLYAKDYYSQSPAQDPPGPAESLDQYRSMRGGCYSCAPFFLRSSFRSYYGQDATMESVGFRVAMDAGEGGLD